VLSALNARLELMLDREHLIGHAWFMKATTLEGLCEVMARKVIPLLQEYFYGAPDRLALVLGHPCDADGRPAVTTGPGFLQVTRIGKQCFVGEVADVDDIIDVAVHPWFRGYGEPEASPSFRTKMIIPSIRKIALPMLFEQLIKGAKP
jgi:hypothetical protein